MVTGVSGSGPGEISLLILVFQLFFCVSGVEEGRAGPGDSPQARGVASCGGGVSLEGVAEGELLSATPAPVRCLLPPRRGVVSSVRGALR